MKKIQGVVWRQDGGSSISIPTVEQSRVRSHLTLISMYGTPLSKKQFIPDCSGNSETADTFLKNILAAVHCMKSGNRWKKS